MLVVRQMKGDDKEGAKAMELRNVSFKLPADLHQKIKAELEAKGFTTGQFFELAVQGYFEEKKGGNNMEATRTLAFTVSEELFQRVKEYLAWYQRKYGRRLTQKEFMLGLLEDAIEEMDGDIAAQQNAGGPAAPERQEADSEDAQDSTSAPENAAESSEDGWADEDPEEDESLPAEENALESAEEAQDSPEDVEE